MRTLLLDIETAPHRAYVWGLFDQRIATNQIVEHGYTLCFAAKWLGERGVIFERRKGSNPRPMLRRVHELLDEADAVVHYNGQRFDVPTLQGEFVRNGFTPPSPFKQVDLLRTCRRQFRFASNKLDFVSQHLGMGGKVAHKGMELWAKCMADDPASWAVMERYNKRDVRLLETLYQRILPWIQNHPNWGAYRGGHECPKCGSDKLQARGYETTQTRTYQRWKCNGCGAWSRSIKCEPGSAKLKAA